MIAAGEFWCPTCFCKRMFVVAEGVAVNDPSPDLECDTCFYVWRKARREYPNGKVETVQMLAEGVRLRARSQWLKDLEAHAVASGFRRENFTHGRSS